MNLYNNQFRFRSDDEENPKELPENPMEKMMSGWQFDKKFIEQRKIFLWGVVDDKSCKDLTQGCFTWKRLIRERKLLFTSAAPAAWLPAAWWYTIPCK